MASARELSQLRSAIEQKSVKLARLYGVNNPGSDGYTPEYCVSTEYLLHEVAHYTTLGRKLKDLPKHNLSNVITDLLEEVSGPTGVELELDTLFVVRLAGVSLNMWSYRTGGFAVAAGMDATLLHEQQVRERLLLRRGSHALVLKAAQLALWHQQVKP